MIEVSGVSVRLSGKTIVRDVAFTAKAGELTAIAGPNGSGKTTTMKAVSGELAYEGSVRLNGEEVHTLKPWQLASIRGVLPQASSISFPFLRELANCPLESRALFALGIAIGAPVPKMGAPAPGGVPRSMP